MRKIKTFTDGKIVGCLRITSEYGYLSYMYITKQGEVDLDNHEDHESCKNIAEQAALYCRKHDCQLISY